MNENMLRLDVSPFTSDEKEIKINLFNGPNFGVQVNSAQVVLQIPAHIKKIKIETVSGDIKLHDLSASPEVHIQTVSGNTKVYFSESPNCHVDFNTVSGNLKISTESSDQSMRHHYDSSVSGLVLGQGQGELQIRSVSGDAKIVQE